MRMDVNLGDLGYRIPYGQTRDLLDPKSGLIPLRVQKSCEEGGSIWKRLQQKVLVVVRKEPNLRPPSVTVAPPDAVVFPQRVRSLQQVNVAEVNDEIQSSIIADDDVLLQEMEMNADGEDDGTTPGGAPVARDGDENKKKEED